MMNCALTQAFGYLELSGIYLISQSADVTSVGDLNLAPGVKSGGLGARALSSAEAMAASTLGAIARRCSMWATQPTMITLGTATITPIRSHCLAVYLTPARLAPD